MKKNILIAIILVVAFHICAQNKNSGGIGINTQNPDVSSVLDINSPSANDTRGLLVPKMTTSQKLAIKSPAHSLLVYDTDHKCLSQNTGIPSLPVWKCLTVPNRAFFYMPSINIPNTPLNTIATIDLYDMYKQQYGSPRVASKDAELSSIPYYQRNQLYYYVTYHNSDKINISEISANGIMTYKILKKPDWDDYINIVFVVK